MKIQYCSDLHLEFWENKEFLMENPLSSIGDILILAGDIIPFAAMNKHEDFFDYISDNFEFTYWLPGNHEYYYFDAINKTGFLNEKIRSNLFLVNNEIVRMKDIKLVFTTLWSNISLANQWAVLQSLSDFKVIKYDSERFTPIQFNQFHQDCKDFLISALSEKNDCKTVVITHHVPTFFNYPEKYKGDAVNEAFAVELYDFIENSSIDYWIYGHHHNNTPDFEIGKTWLITNQLGYVKYNEHKGFKSGNIINLFV